MVRVLAILLYFLAAVDVALFAKAWAPDRAMTVEQVVEVVAYALEDGE